MVYPPSAARGFIAEKDSVDYQETFADYLNIKEDIIIVRTSEKEYLVRGHLSFPNKTSRLIGGGRWEFDILEEKNL